MNVMNVIMMMMMMMMTHPHQERLPRRWIQPTDTSRWWQRWWVLSPTMSGASNMTRYRYPYRQTHVSTDIGSRYFHMQLDGRSVRLRALDSTSRLDRRKVMTMKSIYLLNVVVKQEILIRTQKTKQATYCPVACNRAPFITSVIFVLIYFLVLVSF